MSMSFATRLGAVGISLVALARGRLGEDPGISVVDHGYAVCWIGVFRTQSFEVIGMKRYDTFCVLLTTWYICTSVRHSVRMSFNSLWARSQMPVALCEAGLAVCTPGLEISMRQFVPLYFILCRVTRIADHRHLF